MTAKSSAWQPVEFISLLALFSLIILLRVHYLDADPPIDLSNSTGVYTDPGQYTLFARNYVQSGEFDPFHDIRRPVFIKSSMTALSVVVFSLLGTGIWASNFVGFLYALGALFLFYLFIRKTAGLAAGLVFLLLISFNYNLIFYGKLSFLEHAMAFYAFLALVLISFSRRWYIHLLAGMSLAVGIFFGKIIGLIFIVPFVCWFIYDLFYQTNRPLTMLSLNKVASFAFGFIVVALSWYYFVYAPFQQQVTGYFGEQTFFLYGMPDGLRSFDDFIYKMLTFGVDSKLFPRMRSVGVLGAVFVGIFLFHITRWRSLKNGFGAYKAGHVFTAVMIIAFYGALMIWNYRPLRYQLVMIYPFYGAASIVMIMLWQKWKERETIRFPWLFMLLSIPLIMIPAYQLLEGLAEKYEWGFYYDDDKYWIAGLSILISILTTLYIKYKPLRKTLELPLLAKATTIIIIVVNLSFGLNGYYNWYNISTFTARDNSLDLGIILNNGAVISGPYAPLMITENNLGCIIHMFGVSHADLDLFKKFPITHLLVDRPNEARARADYREVLRNAPLLQEYIIGNKKVMLYQIAHLTGNAEADSYQPSLFEQAIAYCNENNIEQARKELLKLVAANPENISANTKLAELAKNQGQLKLAESYWKKAVEFSPTNYKLIYGLANCYRQEYLKRGDRQLYDNALKLYDKAVRYAPRNSELLAARRALLNDRSWLKDNESPSWQETEKPVTE